MPTEKAWADAHTRRLETPLLNLPTEIALSLGASPTLSWDSGGELNCTACLLANTVSSAPMHFEKVAKHSQLLTRNLPLECFPAHFPAPFSLPRNPPRAWVEIPGQSALKGPPKLEVSHARLRCPRLLQLQLCACCQDAMWKGFYQKCKSGCWRVTICCSLKRTHERIAIQPGGIILASMLP